MLDTVKLCLNDWEIKDTSQVVIQPSPVHYGTGELTSHFPLWKKGNGDVEMGSKAYLNTQLLNVDIKPFAQGGVQCFVHFSIPKIHNGENYYSVGKEGTRAVLKKVEGELSEAGIETNIEEASLSRIDTFQNVITEEPFISYSPLFSLLQASRKVKRDYGTTFLWSNTQQELCVYDKLVEMQNRKIDTSSYPAQTMRFEWRLLNKKKIENAIGFSKVKELPSYWGEVKEKYREAWKKDIFNMEVGEVEVLASRQLKGFLQYFKDKHGRNYIDYFLTSFGAYSLGKEFGIEPLRIAIREIEEEESITGEEEERKREAIKKKVHRLYKKVEKARREMEFIRGESGESKTLAGLYKELQVKLCLN